MIKFFRNIRKQLLGEGKTAKYFKYAVGEIVLVVIGILIALQINNWNNQRIENNKEQIILTNLSKEYRNNIDEFNRIYSSSKISYKSSLELLEIIKNDKNINAEEIEELLDKIINNFFSLDLNSGTIDEIKNSGSLSIIKDAELRNHISNWSFLVADTEDDIEIYNNYMFGVLIPSLTEKSVLRNMAVPKNLLNQTGLPSISRSNYTVDYNKTIRTLEFENQLYNNALNTIYVLDAYKKIETYLHTTLKVINSNINVDMNSD